MSYLKSKMFSFSCIISNQTRNRVIFGNRTEFPKQQQRQCNRNVYDNNVANFVAVQSESTRS